MDYDTSLTEESMNKNFQSKITITSEVSTYSPVENGFTNLAEALLVNEYQTTSLDVAKNKINSKQEVDFSKTAPIIVWEEKESSITTTSAGKIDESVIGNYGVTEKTVKLLVGTSYSFDSETGYYKLENGSYYDPIALDYVNNNYYYCIAAVSLGANDIIKSDDATSCSTMYKLMALTSVEESPIILSDGTEVPSKKYNFKALKYTEIELESDKSDKGLYESLDDDGTTYYYRGNVTNNYVKFAGYYWRIIRINGDGSIRLLYSGTSRDSFGADLMIATSVFNSNRKSHTYVGYMYSNTINTSYEDTIKNENNSIIKSTIDNWYNVNIEEKGYSSYIADSGFCNDRSISNDSIGDGSNDSISTLYSAEKRVKTYSPSLICPNATTDLFTLAGNTKGNNKLTYPIGLMTIDEILYAGLKQGYINKLSYIQANYDWWTMTPVLFDASSNTARVFNVREDGATSGNSVTSTYGVRPVINLKSTTEITGGIGTSNDPFIIK